MITAGLVIVISLPSQEVRRAKHNLYIYNGQACPPGANRADDCLPFYHLSSAASDTEFSRGQFWNRATVRAVLPDVIMQTDIGKSYASIKDAMTWDFLDPVALGKNSRGRHCHFDKK